MALDAGGGAPSAQAAAEPAQEGLLSSFSDRLATAEEAALLLELRRELAEDLAAAPGFPELVGDVRLLRTLRGFEHSVQEAAEAFRGHLRRRQEFGLNRIRERLWQQWSERLHELRFSELPHADVVRSYMPEVAPYAWNPQGDPINLALWGQSRPADYVCEVEDWEAKAQEHIAYQCEAWALLLEYHSREQGRLVHIVNVVDLEGWSMLANYDGDWMAFTRERLTPITTSYHDFFRWVLFVRSSRWFRLPFNLMNPLFPKKFQDKISLFGDDFGTSRELNSKLGVETVQFLVDQSTPTVAVASRRQPPSGAAPAALQLAPSAAPGQTAARGPCRPARRWGVCSLCCGRRSQQLARRSWRVLKRAARRRRGMSDRVYFAVVDVRSDVDVDLQSRLHVEVIAPLISQGIVKQFRVLQATPRLFVAGSPATLVVFELLVPHPWPITDWDVGQWRRSLGPRVWIAGPEDEAAEVTEQVHEAARRALAGKGGAGAAPTLGEQVLPLLCAVEQIAGSALAPLVMLMVCIWLSL